MNRPMPDPPYVLCVLLVACSNGMKRRACSSDVIPMPESCTDTTKVQSSGGGDDVPAVDDAAEAAGVTDTGVLLGSLGSLGWLGSLGSLGSLELPESLESCGPAATVAVTRTRRTDACRVNLMALDTRLTRICVIR